MLEYFPGQSLSEYVARNGPFAPEDWLEVCWPIGRALQAMHGRGVLHRNLRPGNVLIIETKNRDGARRFQVKLLEAGLAIKRAVIHARASNQESLLHSGLGRSVAQRPLFPTRSCWPAQGPGLGWAPLRHLQFRQALRLRSDRPARSRRRRPLAAARRLADHPGRLHRLDDQSPARPHRRRRRSHRPDARRADVVGRIERELHESTITELTAIIEADPTSATAYINRGNAHARQGNHALAVTDFTQAMTLQPDDADLYRRAPSRTAAIKTPTTPSPTTPRRCASIRAILEALVNRGLAHAQKGDNDKAVADYSEGLQLNPRDEILYYNRGNAWFAMGDLDRAVADYTEALRLDPRNLWALGNRGKTYAARGEHVRAVADFTRILQLDPHSVKALADRAAAQFDLGRTDCAIADYTQAIKLEPSAGLYHDRGLAHATAGNLEQAVNDFTEALSLSPENAALLLSRTSPGRAGTQRTGVRRPRGGVAHRPGERRRPYAARQSARPPGAVRAGHC